MIRIEKIEFSNFRQYRNISIDFPNTNRYHLHVLRAKNGTGKTTLLNGILWCFYGKEYYISNEDKALPIINDGLVEESNNGDCLDVHVKITIVDDDSKSLVFDRKQTFQVLFDHVRNKKTVIGNQAQLTITVTELNTSTNSVVVEDPEEVLSLVKQYFDESIYDYYFFDGENLKSYFEKGKSEKIKDSIFNISQVTLLKNASSHTLNYATEKYRSASKMASEDISSLYEEEKTLKQDIEKLEDDNRNIENNLPIYQSKVDECDTVLREFAPVKSNQEKREEYLKQLNNYERQLKTTLEEKAAFIRKNIVLLNFYPRIKRTYDFIIKKEQEGNLPPNIDKNEIVKILNEHLKKCPICDGEIGPKAVEHLKSLLEKLDVSSETSNYLMSIKSSLENMVEECKKYPENKEKLLKTEKYLKDEINRINKELDKISAFLSNWANDGEDTVNVSKAEKDRKYFQDLITTSTAKMAVNNRDITSFKERLISVTKEIDNYQDKKSNKDILDEQIKVLRKLSSSYDSVRNRIMAKIKEEIQKETWNRFDSMIWKQNTFGGLEIDDNYEIVVKNTNGKEMFGSLGATEYMALAYAFTLAIHQASGKNCPLVVDSPLGRVSDDNRTNMATELLKVSMDKQIIMLFTPDEFSEEVHKVYDNNACSIRDIVLSTDETQIMKIGD